MSTRGTSLSRARKPLLGAGSAPGPVATGICCPLPGRTFDPALVWTFITHLSIVRSLVLSARFRGWFLISRRTRIKIGPRSKVLISPGGFFFVGFVHFGATPTAIHLGRGATMSVEGTVLIRNGARLYVNDGAHLEWHAGSGVGDFTTVTCFDHIVFEAGGDLVVWQCAGHERPRGRRQR